MAEPEPGTVVDVGTKILPTGRPGLVGSPGPEGPAGGAWTSSTLDFTVPEIGDTVTITFRDPSWISEGVTIFVEGMYGRVTNISGQQVTVQRVAETPYGEVGPPGETGPQGLVDEAPTTGNAYARQDEGWVQSVRRAEFQMVPPFGSGQGGQARTTGNIYPLGAASTTLTAPCDGMIIMYMRVFSTSAPGPAGSFDSPGFTQLPTMGGGGGAGIELSQQAYININDGQTLVINPSYVATNNTSGGSMYSGFFIPTPR